MVRKGGLRVRFFSLYLGFIVKPEEQTTLCLVLEGLNLGSCDSWL
jgi:hypothetical protein